MRPLPSSDCHSSDDENPETDQENDPTLRNITSHGPGIRNAMRRIRRGDYIDVQEDDMLFGIRIWYPAEVSFYFFCFSIFLFNLII